MLKWSDESLHRDHTLPTSIFVIVMTMSVAMVGFHDDGSLILIMLRVGSPSWLWGLGFRARGLNAECLQTRATCCHLRAGRNIDAPVVSRV